MYRQLYTVRTNGQLEEVLGYSFHDNDRGKVSTPFTPCLLCNTSVMVTLNEFEGRFSRDQVCRTEESDADIRRRGLSNTNNY